MSTYIQRNRPLVFNITPVAGSGTNTVTIDARNLDGSPVKNPVTFTGLLTSDSAGVTPATSAPDGGVSASTGAVVTLASGLMYQFITNSAGQCVVTLTDSGTVDFYLSIIRADGTLSTSSIVSISS